MKFSFNTIIWGVLWGVVREVGVVTAACSSNLVVDDYKNFGTNTNSLGQWTSDDGTTTSLKADVTNKKITFSTTASSYFYTTFACEHATTDNYTAITFPIKGPVGASVMLELQTMSTCSATTYTSYYTTINAMTGATQTVTLSLSTFKGANLNAVGGLLWESFSLDGAWEIGETMLVCGGVGGVSSSSSSKVSSVSSSSSTLSTTKVGVVTSSSSSSAISSDTTISTVTPSITTKVLTSSTSATAPAGTCTNLLIDDFASQSRLTFLFYNAMLQPSSDDGTMLAVTGRVDTGTSVIVSNNHVTLTSAADGSSYWYTMLGCISATNIYGGIGLTISAPKGTTMGIELQTSSTCDSGNVVSQDVSEKDLGWTFDGTEKFYTIPFAKFPGLDADHLIALLFSSISNPITLGPISFYCGTTGTAYPIPSTVAVIEPTSTVPATTGPSAYVIDTFGNSDSNNLGFYHGGDDATTYSQANGKLTINTKGNSDLSWYTQLSSSCINLVPSLDGYIHISYSGSNAFTVALQQHNPTCNSSIAPFPYTWDSVEASRYSNTAKSDLYIPLSHFNINLTTTIGLALKGFFTSDSTVISAIELVKTVPEGFLVPSKLPTAPLIFACTRPNSFAFAIDDGDPALAQQVVRAVAAAGIHVTFFTVGAALLDSSTNLSTVYMDMMSRGHQVAYHSYTHPPMEGLPSLAAIDWELNNDINAVSSTLSGHTSTYFRPPFGTEGARIRQRLAALIPESKFIAWSVDVQDWLWALSDTPEKQLDAFQSDVDKGGNLVVMHYLYESTVGYLPQFLEIARATGKQLMRVDQCLEDVGAPPL